MTTLDWSTIYPYALALAYGILAHFLIAYESLNAQRIHTERIAKQYEEFTS